MIFNNVAIQALAYELPPQRITSSYIEAQFAPTMERLRIPQGIVVAFTGIRERRFWAAGSMPSDAATIAAEKAIAQAGIERHQLGALINASVSKDYLEPSTASLVHGNLGLSPHCRNFDLGNACLGFIDGMCQVGMMIEMGDCDYGMVVAGESARFVVESTIELLRQPEASMQGFRDNFATLTLGSGAVAMVLCRADLATTTHRLNGAVRVAATEYNRLCLGQPHQMTTDASALMAAGSKLAAQTWQVATKTLPNWADEHISVYVPHQVSDRNTKMVSQSLAVPLNKMHLNYQKLGNIGAAAVPITLKMADEAGRMQQGDQVALLGIGSGLNCAMMSVTW